MPRSCVFFNSLVCLAVCACNAHAQNYSAMTLPDMCSRMNAFGLEIHTEPPEFFTEAIRKDFATWGKLARDIGFKPR